MPIPYVAPASAPGKAIARRHGFAHPPYLDYCGNQEKPVTPTEHIRRWQGQLADWRRDFHAHPELGLEEHRTAALVAERLSSWGIEVHRGVGGSTGVVGTLRNGRGNRAVGLRADMDALPMEEENDFAHRSTAPGRMHACGHDGHTTMLLGAARYLAETRRFDGTVHFIFQPAEEGGGGAARHGGGRAVRALPLRRGLRAAQPAGHGGRPLRHPRRAR